MKLLFCSSNFIVYKWNINRGLNHVIKIFKVKDLIRLNKKNWRPIWALLDSSQGIILSLIQLNISILVK